MAWQSLHKAIRIVARRPPDLNVRTEGGPGAVFAIIGAGRYARFFRAGVYRVSSSSPSRETAAGLPIADPNHSPTYPQRVHLHERGQQKRRCDLADQQLELNTLQKLNVLANHAEKPRFVRLYQQMQGARDQVADAVRRLPLEVGGLYDEDHERFQNGMEAMERIGRKWSGEPMAQSNLGVARD